MQTGRITVITGPMFSEKSGELIRRCQKLIQFGRKKVVAYKPAEDDRFAQDEIVSRIGYRLPAHSIPRQLTPESVETILNQTIDADVVAFDEVQFFSSAIMELVSELAYCGKHVIVDGLNMDYRGKEFGYIGGPPLWPMILRNYPRSAQSAAARSCFYTADCQRGTRYSRSSRHDWRFGGL